MIDLSKVKGLADDVKGAIKQITDAAGNVLWKSAPSEATIFIAGSGVSPNNSTYASVTVDGVEYNSATVLTVPIGTVIAITAKSGHYENPSSITLPEGTTKVAKAFEVTGDTAIYLSVNKGTDAYGYATYSGHIKVAENATVVTVQYQTLMMVTDAYFVGVNMTWNDFINSGMSDSGKFVITDGVVYLTTFIGNKTMYYGGVTVKATDLIVSTGQYTAS